MSKLILVIPVVLLISLLTFLKARLTPPDEVIGSCLEDTEARAHNLIKHARNQHYRETWSRSCNE